MEGNGNMSKTMQALGAKGALIGAPLARQCIETGRERKRADLAEEECRQLRAALDGALQEVERLACLARLEMAARVRWQNEARAHMRELEQAIHMAPEDVVAKAVGLILKGA